jgi:hypothetical protein
MGELSSRYWQTGNIIHIGDPMGEASIELTKEEYDALMLERAKKEVRTERDSLIQEVEWRVRRHQDEVALGIEPTDPLLPLLEYIQNLRDVPQQNGFPYEIEWPAEPWDMSDKPTESGGLDEGVGGIE